MSYKDKILWKSGYKREEEQAAAADQDTQPQEPLDPEAVELKKYEARRKITRMVIMRLIMSAMLIWTAFWFAMPVAVRILLIAVVVMILGTMIPVLTTLKTTLKYEDE